MAKPSEYRFIQKKGEADLLKQIPAAFEDVSIILLKRGAAKTVRKGGIISQKKDSNRSSELKLKIFNFSDLHNTLLKGERILSSIQRKKESAQVKGEYVLACSAGDDHVGTIFDASLEFPDKFCTRSTAYKIYNEIPIDFLVIGNHELDFGFDMLSESISLDANFPVFTANIIHPLLPGFAGLIGTIQGWKIGVVGITTLEDIKVEENSEREIIFEEPEHYFIRLLEFIKGGIDFLVVLSHLGLSPNENNFDDFCLARLLKKNIRFPSIIIGGHSHIRKGFDKEQFSKDDVPIFQTGAYGNAFGEINITLTCDNPGEAKNKTSCLINAVLHEPLEKKEKLKTASKIETLIRTEYARFEQFITKDGGKLHSAVYPEKIKKCDKFFTETPTANAITDALAAIGDEIAGREIIERNKVVAACDSTCFMEYTAEKKKSLSVSDWYEIIPYADTVYAGWITTLELLSLVRLNCSHILEPYIFTEYGGSIKIDDWETVKKGHLHFSQGVRYKIVSKEIVMEEGGFAAGKIFFVINSTIAKGGQGWEKNNKLFNTGITLRQAMIRAAEKGHVFQFQKDGRVSAH